MLKKSYIEGYMMWVILINIFASLKNEVKRFLIKLRTLTLHLLLRFCKYLLQVNILFTLESPEKKTQ